MLLNLKNLKRKLLIELKKIKRGKTTPHSVSLGFAIGVFVSFLPPIPYLHTVSALLLAIALKANKISAYIGIWLNNPITITLYVFLSLKVGHFVRYFFPHSPTFVKFGIIGSAVDYFVGAFVAAATIGLICAIISYYALLVFLKRYYKKKRIKITRIK